MTRRWKSALLFHPISGSGSDVAQGNPGGSRGGFRGVSAARRLGFCFLSLVANQQDAIGTCSMELSPGTERGRSEGLSVMGLSREGPCSPDAGDVWLVACLGEGAIAVGRDDAGSSSPEGRGSRLPRCPPGTGEGDVPIRCPMVPTYLSPYRGSPSQDAKPAHAV